MTRVFTSIRNRWLRGRGRRLAIAAAVAAVSILAGAATLAAQAPAESLRSLEQQRESRTISDDGRIALGRIYVDRGRFYEAATLAKEVLAGDPENAGALALAADAQGGMKALQAKRVADAEAVAARRGATREEQFALAGAYFSAGRYPEAIGIWEKELRDGGPRDERMRYARALAWSGRRDAAERVYRQLLAEGSTPELELEYGRTLASLGAVRTAITRLEALYAASPSDEVAVALSDAWASDGNREKALGLLEAHRATGSNGEKVAERLESLRTTPHLRLERLGKLIEAEPYNLALRIERARLLLDAGRHREALRTIDFIAENSPEPPGELEELRARATELWRIESARVNAEKTQALADGASPASLRRLAKSYASLREYDEAIALYERYLVLEPADLDAKIELARVLGWDRRYRRSARLYRQLVGQLPDRADLRLEYGRILSQDSRQTAAVRVLRDLTDLSWNEAAHLYESVPAQAHFHLGQIYRWYGWRENAVRQQTEALALDSSFTLAERELERAQRSNTAPSVEARYTHSEDRSGFELERYDVTFQRRVSPRAALDLSIGEHRFARRERQVDAQVAMGGLRYRLHDQLSARARIGGNRYDNEVGTRAFWSGGLEWLPTLQSRVALDYSRYDLVYDVLRLDLLGPSTAISVDDLRLHLGYRSGGLFEYLANATTSDLSDGNGRTSAFGMVTLRLSRSPWVAVKAEGRYLSYDYRTPRYWSPADYESFAGVLHVGHDFRNRFSWQAEYKQGKSRDTGRERDLRTVSAIVTVPVTDGIELVGSWRDGRSGRIDAFFGGDDIISYWQTQWYVGLRVRRFPQRDRPSDGPSGYYFDETLLQQSPVLAPAGEAE
jgi:tetratricopeptide (TPR) repeat protein